MRLNLNGSLGSDIANQQAITRNQKTKFVLEIPASNLGRVQIPFVYGDLDFTIDWGDGNTQSYQGKANSAIVYHDYATAGTYTLILDGTYPNLRSTMQMSSNASVGRWRDYLIEAEIGSGWGVGTVVGTNPNENPYGQNRAVWRNAFTRCLNLEKCTFLVPNATAQWNMRGMFLYAGSNKASALEINMDAFDFSTLKRFSQPTDQWGGSMESMFQGCGLVDFNMSSVNLSPTYPTRWDMFRFLLNFNPISGTAGVATKFATVQQYDILLSRIVYFAERYYQGGTGFADPYYNGQLKMGASKYSANGAVNRSKLINTYNFSIQDGGQE